MTKTNAKLTVSGLAEQLMLHKRAYYQGKPTISDAAFDALEEQLRRLAPGHPVLNFVGSDEVSSLEKITHNTPMLSLQKTYTMEELETWCEPGEVVAALKIDGNSISLMYENSGFQMAKTRGNGQTGENVTNKLLWCENIPFQIPSNHNLEIRGELVCKESSFFELCNEMKELDLAIPTNPRNTVAGILGRKQHIHFAKYFDFIAFDLIDSKKFKQEWEKIKSLKEWGFEVANPKLIQTFQGVRKYLDSIEDEAAQTDYAIDGVVFTYNDVSLQQSLGYTSHHPRYRIAFKWQGDTAQTVIHQIHWATSRLGIVTPVAKIEPTELSGATITNVTLHNAANVRNLNLKPGDQIKIVRSGEVIPKLLEVLRPTTGTAEFPKTCSECGTVLEFDDVRLKCTNSLGCPAQQLGQILNWIKKTGIDDLSEKRLTVMIEQGLVESIADLYRLDHQKLLSLPQTKEKLAQKLLNNIEQSKIMPLYVFLDGLGIEGVGQSSWQKIAAQYATLKDVLSLTAEQIADLEGFAQKSAAAIIAGLQDRKKIIDELKTVGITIEAARVQDNTATYLSGCTFVLTGKLTKPREEISKNLISLGAKVSSSTSANTTALICEDPTGKSSKLVKARKLEVPIWGETQLEEFIIEKSNNP